MPECGLQQRWLGAEARGTRVGNAVLLLAFMLLFKRCRVVAVYARFVSSSVTRWSFTASACFLCLAAFSFGATKDWAAVDPKDLAAKDSASSVGADLEILFSNHTLKSFDGENWTDNYVRAKVYTPRGVEKMSVLRIEYAKRFRIRNLAARVVKPDGTSLELSKGDFHETTSLKWNGGALQVVSFAFPNVVAGDIVEYRWSESMGSTTNYFYSMYCQEEVPVREFAFDVKGSVSDFNLMCFNTPNVEAKKISHYESTLRAHNLPAFERESLMPPERDFRGYLIVLFSGRYLRFFSNDDVWQEIGAYEAEEFRLATDPTANVKSTAKALVVGAKTPEEKLARLYDFCQKEITNLEMISSTELMQAKQKRDDAEDAQSASDTLSRKTGLPVDINRLFASLARALGFEVHLGESASREEILNIRTPKGWLFLRRTIVLVRVGESWLFYSPGEYLVPAGMLSPKDEMATVFVCDEKKSWYETTAISPASQNVVSRKGRFTLSEDGTLDGDVEIRMTGHAAVAKKQAWWGKEENEATKQYQEQIAANVPTAELSEIVWENLKNNVFPLVLRYKVHVPGYAEVAGSRLIVAPDFFEAGKGPLFTAETRKYPILFDYGYKQLDDVEIVWPEGYTVEGASAPKNVGEPTGEIEARYGVKIRPKARVIGYQRECMVGNGIIGFRPDNYAKIKQLFDEISRSDKHSFVLKPKPTAAEVPSATAPAVAK